MACSLELKGSLNKLQDETKTIYYPKMSNEKFTVNTCGVVSS